MSQRSTALHRNFPEIACSSANGTSARLALIQTSIIRALAGIGDAGRERRCLERSWRSFLFAVRSLYRRLGTAVYGWNKLGGMSHLRWATQATRYSATSIRRWRAQLTQPRRGSSRVLGKPTEQSLKSLQNREVEHTDLPMSASSYKPRCLYSCAVIHKGERQ